MYNVSLSSMWAVGRLNDAAAFVAAARQVGCAHVEANHEMPPAMFEGLVRLSQEQPGLVTSVHDPCPATTSLREMTQQDQLLSSLDPDRRGRAVQIARQSIAAAQAVGARVVVLHIGRVRGPGQLEKRLRERYSPELWATPETDQRRQELIRERARLRGPFLEAVITSLLELVPAARAAGVRLGLENRYYYPEIPAWDEVGILLDRLPADVVGYWHDTGHAQALETLGLGLHEDWLRAYGPRCIGIHLHDCAGLHDHQPPGRGTMDWEMIRQHLPATALRVLEVGRDHSAEDLAAGVRYLAARGFYDEA